MFVTVTGDREVIRAEHIKLMKDGAIVCNSGHFDVEIDLAALKKLSSKVEKGLREIDVFHLPNGRKSICSGRAAW